MVLSFLSGGKGAASVDELIARKKYGKAIELLRAEFKGGSRDPRLRLQLADVLALAGKGKEALPILLGLADEFALEGYAAKAISVLKKAQKIDPVRRDVEAKLAKLIKEKVRDTPSGTSHKAAAPEIGLELGIAGTPARLPAEPQPAARPPEAVLQPAGLSEFQRQADALELLELEPDPETPIDALGDELLGVIEDVLRQGPAVAAPAPLRPAVDSPLFSSFSQEELVAVIHGLELLSFEPGDILISEGEPGDSLFVLTSGVVKAFVRNPAGKNVQLREMPEGSFFGEISVLSGKPRTATITAKTRCELLELGRATLDSISKTHPHVREVLQRFYQERLRNEEEQRIRSGKG